MLVMLSTSPRYNLSFLQSGENSGLKKSPDEPLSISVESPGQAGSMDKLKRWQLRVFPICSLCPLGTTHWELLPLPDSNLYEHGEYKRDTLNVRSEFTSSMPPGKPCAFNSLWTGPELFRASMTSCSIFAQMLILLQLALYSLHGCFCSNCFHFFVPEVGTLEACHNHSNDRTMVSPHLFFFLARHINKKHDILIKNYQANFAGLLVLISISSCTQIFPTLQQNIDV